MWRACLSDAPVAGILRKHFIVVSDPIAKQNKTSFGVKVWMFDANRRELRNYWYGTGNCLISNVFTEEYHNKRVTEMVRVLTESLQIAAGRLKAAREVNGKLESVDVDAGKLTVRVGFGQKAKQHVFQVSKDTAIANGLNKLKKVTPLKEGLRSPLFEPGSRLRIATRTDKSGVESVHEVRITGRVLFRRRK